MTGIIRIGVTERGSFKEYSEAVHIPLFKGVGTKAELSHDVHVFSYARAMK